MSWNSTPVLSVTNIVRFRLISFGPLSNLFDDLASSLIIYINTSYNAGDEVFLFASPARVSTFTIDHHRQIYKPGFQYFKNGVLV